MKLLEIYTIICKVGSYEHPILYSNNLISSESHIFNKTKAHIILHKLSSRFIIIL